jgi:hypothetical protein
MIRSGAPRRAYKTQITTVHNLDRLNALGLKAFLRYANSVALSSSNSSVSGPLIPPAEDSLNAGRYPEPQRCLTLPGEAPYLVTA